MPDASHLGSPEVQSSGVGSAIPSLAWILLTLIAIFVFRRDIQALIRNLSWRLRTGAALKLFSIELGVSYVSPSIDSGNSETTMTHRTDANDARFRQRQQYYEPNRNVPLVYRLAPSDVEGMLYDIQLYLIPHKDATLGNVSKVEYYFGKHWGSQIFVSVDRARGFPITTSAYGPFMCTADIYFSDGQSIVVNRYVDFEMGAIGTKG